MSSGDLVPLVRYSPQTFLRRSLALFNARFYFHRIQAIVDGDKNVTIKAFRPLPHTGLPLEVKSVVRAEEEEEALQG